ncbi:hypothetical protein NQK81_30830 [Amycolatopsis roodepoortensis]|uniref:hypothetical protein n=1 Tax=Amycolatopsis roodepoortensis TaxID=700274 RepID=UPI00214BDBCF|nr:hypothetical protein [Amycolatopsis roodepoortensis]UUV29154.1 hypothetical protein NQK81_30830 [Amycolatopsis roodepoortensis]
MVRHSLVTRRRLFGRRRRLPTQHPVEVPCVADEYEWRQFAGTSHLYPVARLADEWATVVVAWCERQRPWPVGHDVGEVGRMRLDARHRAVVGACEDCEHLQRLAHMDARHRAREARRARA